MDYLVGFTLRAPEGASASEFQRRTRGEGTRVTELGTQRHVSGVWKVVPLATLDGDRSDGAGRAPQRPGSVGRTGVMSNQTLSGALPVACHKPISQHVAYLPTSAPPPRQAADHGRPPSPQTPTLLPPRRRPRRRHRPRPHPTRPPPPRPADQWTRRGPGFMRNCWRPAARTGRSCGHPAARSATSATPSRPRTGHCCTSARTVYAWEARGVRAPGRRRGRRLL
jgi:hypothetical protein